MNKTPEAPWASKERDSLDIFQAGQREETILDLKKKSAYTFNSIPASRKMTKQSPNPDLILFFKKKVRQGDKDQ